MLQNFQLPIRFNRCLFIVFCILYISSIAFAQTKIAVEVEHSGNDPVGQRLVYKLKENIRSSGLLKLTTINEPRFIISIITIDTETTNTYKGYSCAYSLVWILCIKKDYWDKKYIRHKVGICGSDRVNEVAERIVAQTDIIVSDFLKVIGGTYK